MHHINNSCLNCGNPLSGNYCQHCGQKAAVKRLSWHSIAEELFHFFTHIEKGFFKTVTMLAVRPGRLFKDYLDGKRKTYHKPVSFLLIWIAVFLLIFALANKVTHYTTFNTSGLMTFNAAEWTVINKYRTLVEVLILPFTALITWIVLARPKLNYVEVLSVSFYVISFLFILLSIQMVIALLFGINFRTNAFDLITVGVFIVWVLYAGYDFYKRYVTKFLIPRLLLSMAINAVVYFLLAGLIAKAILALH